MRIVEHHGKNVYAYDGDNVENYVLMDDKIYQNTIKQLL